MNKLLNKWHAEQIKTYSFIDDAKIEGVRIKIFYKVKGKDVVKSISTRASIKSLQNTINKIRNEIGEINEQRKNNYYII